MDRSISFPCKRAEPAQLDKVILEHIKQQMKVSGGDATADYTVAVSELAQLRSSCLEKVNTPNDYNLKAMMRYYGLLLSAIKRFPFCLDEAKKVETLATKFTWSEVFEGPGLFRKASTTMRTVRLEQACVLFNIAALNSQIGAAQGLATDEARKSAAVAFQTAAVLLRHLQQQIPLWLPGAESGDLQPPLLGGLAELMLAQAQEVFWFKCSAEKRAPDLLCKLAGQAADYFGAAHTTLAVRPEVDKAWLALIAAKRLFFLAEAHLQGGKAALAANHGVGLAHLRAARTMAQQVARGSLGAAERVMTLVSQANQAAEAAERENNVIHLKIVPDINTVEPLPKIALANFDKPLPDFASPDIIGRDLFAGLTPLSIAGSVKIFQDKRAAALAELVTKLRDNTAACVAALRAAGLPGALDATATDGPVPQALLDQARAVRDQGGLDAIVAKLDANRAAAESCQQTLRDAETQLDQEQRDYESLAARYGDRWKQQASAGLTEKTRVDAVKYREVLSRSAASDETVRTKLTAARDGILLLSKPDSLATALPAARTAHGTHPSEAELRAALAVLDRLRTQRDDLEKELVALPTDDITAELLDCSAKNVAETTIIEAHLALLEPQRRRVVDVVSESAAALDAVKLAHQQWAQSRGSGAAVTERERMINNLTAAYETFVELGANISEGEKFYNNLTAMLTKYAAKVSDFVASRVAEKEQLLSDISRTIIQTPHEQYQPSAPAPVPAPAPAPAPAYPLPSQQQQQQQQQAYYPPPQPVAPPYGSVAPGPYPSYGGYPPGAYPPTHQQQQQQQQPPAPYNPGHAAYPPSYAGYPPPVAAHPYPPPPQQYYSAYGGGGSVGYAAPPYGVPPATPGPQAGQWQCKACTYYNNEAQSPAQCEMCATPRS